MWWLYNVLFFVLYTLMLPKFIYRMWRRGGYWAGFLERIGMYGPALRARLGGDAPRIWIHAVSVGEMGVGLGVMEELRRLRPDFTFVLSTNTSTGRRVAEERAPEVPIVYFPMDLTPITGRVLDRLRPAALVLIEGELWPNLIRTCARRDVPVFLANGRIGDSSYRGYRRLAYYCRRVLPLFHRVLAQSVRDRERLLDLGAPPERTVVMGTTKYDVPETPDAEQAVVRAALADLGWAPSDPVLMGGSTWPGEERILVDLYRLLRAEYPALRLILVPRHAERTGEVTALLRQRGEAFALRSEPGAGPASVLVVNTTGELKRFYEAATVVFVGKSLTAQGGQNMFEPLAAGKAVLVGPHTQNFAAFVEELVQAGVLRVVADSAALETAVRGLLADPAGREELGRRARAAIRERSGSLARTAQAIAAGLDSPAS